MTDEPKARLVNSASELLYEVGTELDGVQFFQLHAEVNESDGPADKDDSGGSADQPSEIEPAYALKLRYDGREIGIRLSIRLELPAGKIHVDGAVNYIAAEPVLMSEDARLEFANEVGVMALLPYMRQAIADLSQRVFGEPILMPVIPRGALVFGGDDEDDA